MGPKLVAVNRRKYSQEVLMRAIKDAKAGGQPIELLAENA